MATGGWLKSHKPGSVVKIKEEDLLPYKIRKDFVLKTLEHNLAATKENELVNDFSEWNESKDFPEDLPVITSQETILQVESSPISNLILLQEASPILILPPQETPHLLTPQENYTPTQTMEILSQDFTERGILPEQESPLITTEQTIHFDILTPFTLNVNPLWEITPKSVNEEEFIEPPLKKRKDDFTFCVEPTILLPEKSKHKTKVIKRKKTMKK